MARIVISPKADADLDDQFLVIAENNLDAAMAEDAISLLARMPDLGVSVSLHQMRFWPMARFRNHLIFYRPIPGGIEIVRVLHGARDWTRVIEDDLDL